MRDIELEPLPDDPGNPGGTPPVPPTAGDDAYARPSPGGVNAAANLTDPSFANDKAYTMPCLGGEFGPGRAVLVSGPADGGKAKLGSPPAVVATPAPVEKPAYAMTGRSWNQSTYANLYPWTKTPREGLDSNNPPVASSMVESATVEETTEEPETETEHDDPAPKKKGLFSRKPAAKHK